MSEESCSAFILRLSLGHSNNQLIAYYVSGKNAKYSLVKDSDCYYCKLNFSFCWTVGQTKLARHKHKPWLLEIRIAILFRTFHKLNIKSEKVNCHTSYINTSSLTLNELGIHIKCVIIPMTENLRQLF